jgi:hypothetical protein
MGVKHTRACFQESTRNDGLNIFKGRAARFRAVRRSPAYFDANRIWARQGMNISACGLSLEPSPRCRYGVAGTVRASVAGKRSPALFAAADSAGREFAPMAISMDVFFGSTTFRPGAKKCA